MKTSILTIGDELLIGQVLNSNVQWISEKLTELGITVHRQLTVGDEFEAIHAGIQFLLTDSDAIIIGGGLGPTHDDLTLETLSQIFSIPLAYDAEWISRVEAFFKARNRTMSENNKKQGFMLKTATRIDNDCGTAAGQFFEVNHPIQPQKKISIFVVPGVPHEMKSMMDRFILPKLIAATTVAGEKILKQTLQTTGMGESALALKCDPFVKKIKAYPNLSLAFLPNSMQVRLRLQMRAKSKSDEELFERLVQELISYCGKDFYALEPLSLEQLIVNTLIENNETLALAESCTGGLISHKITQAPGASQVLRGSLVAYQRTLKETELNIESSLIDQNGIVSEQTAIAMADAIRKKWNTTYGIASTGYLGPEGGDSFAKLGTVWLAIATPQGCMSKSFSYENNRERSKERAAISALDLLRRTFLRLENDTTIP